MSERELIEKLLLVVEHINLGPKSKWGVEYDLKAPTASIQYDQKHIDTFYEHAKNLLNYGLSYLPEEARKVILSELAVGQ